MNVEISAEREGTLKKILKQEGETVRVGEAIALLGEAGGGEAPAGEAEKEAEEPGSDPPEPREAEGNGVDADRPSPADLPVATPAARKWARERGIDLRRVSTRDPRGRVTAEDVRNYGAEVPPAEQAPDGPKRDRPVEKGDRAGGAGPDEPAPPAPSPPAAWRPAHRRDADDLQRDGHERHHGDSQAAQRSVSRAARRRAGLHVLLHQGRRSAP